MLRAAWRTLALTGGETAGWLVELDRFVRAEVDDEKLATVCVGLLDPASRSLTVWLDSCMPAYRIDEAQLERLVHDIRPANGAPLVDDVAVVVLAGRAAHRLPPAVEETAQLLASTE